MTSTGQLLALPQRAMMTWVLLWIPMLLYCCYCSIQTRRYSSAEVAGQPSSTRTRRQTRKAVSLGAATTLVRMMMIGSWRHTH